MKHNFFKRNLLTASIQAALSNSTPNRLNNERNAVLDKCWLVYDELHSHKDVKVGLTVTS